MSHPIKTEFIQRRLVELNVSLSQVAKMMNFSYEGLRVLMERKTAPLATIHKLAKALLVAPEDLVGNGTPSVTPHDTGAEPMTPAKRVSKPHQLPAALPDFIGRDEAVISMTRLVLKHHHEHCVIGLYGMGGIGKTTLAVAVAHAVKAKFPHGQLFIDVLGMNETPMPPRMIMESVLTGLLGAREGWPENDDDLLASYRTGLSGKRLLLVLDNVHNERQIIPLLAGDRCTFLLTSRNRLPLDHSYSQDVKLFEAETAHAFMESLVRNRANANQIELIAQYCGFLPLALRVAGVFLRESLTWTADAYIDELEREALSVLSVGSDASKNVEAVLKLSATQLVRENPTLALRWRQLADRHADLTSGSIAAAWELKPNQREILDSLTSLVNRSLLLFDPVTNGYRLHDLLRPIAKGLFR
jgi:hypothetical protein